MRQLLTIRRLHDAIIKELEINNSHLFISNSFETTEHYLVRFYVTIMTPISFTYAKFERVTHAKVTRQWKDPGSLSKQHWIEIYTADYCLFSFSQNIVWLPRHFHLLLCNCLVLSLFVFCGKSNKVTKKKKLLCKCRANMMKRLF